MKKVFIHGLGQSANSWDKVACHFEDAVVPNLLELLGDNPVIYENLYQSFVSYCQQFVEPIAFCGLSLGGVLALNYAIDYPEKVDSLVLIGAQYKMPSNLLKLQNVIFKVLPEKIFQAEGFTKKDFIGLTKSMFYLDFSRQLEKINCPTLVLVGEKDIPNKKSCKRLAGFIKNARFEQVEKSGHIVNEDNPEKLVTLLTSFW